MIDTVRTHFDLTAHSQMWLRCPRPLLLVSLLIQVLPSIANTEIINLTPSPRPHIYALDSISSSWPVLTPLGGQNERRWTMTHVPQEGDTEGCIGKREWCEDDLWLVLDFDAEEWNTYRGFTLRISWPASVSLDRPSVQLFSRVEPLENSCVLTLRKSGFFFACCSTRLIFSWRHTHHMITLSKPALKRHGLLTSRPTTPILVICTLASDRSIPGSWLPGLSVR